MSGKEMARNLRYQESGRGKCHATAACTPMITREPARHHESADDYHGIVIGLSTNHRVITCKDQLQWVLQRRDGERHGRARWAGVGYFLTRDALLRASRALCTRIYPTAFAALVALPEHFGRVGAWRPSPRQQAVIRPENGTLTEAEATLIDGDNLMNARRRARRQAPAIRERIARG
jgi:hypothetical protein